MKLKVYLTLLFLGLSLSGCGRSYLCITQQKVDCRYLASSHVGSPDPRLACPPCGQKLLLEWKIPRALVSCCPYIELHVIYWDYTEEIFTYPLSRMIGYTCYSLLDCEYEAKGGILTYRADLKLEDGTVCQQWQHQLWVNLIEVAESTSSSVEGQPMQESVIETPYSSESETT